MDRIERLKKRETRLVNKGKKAVDEGRNNRADRILGRAAKVENRIIKLEEKKKKYLPEGRRGGAVPKGYHKMPDGKIMKDSTHKKLKKVVTKKSLPKAQPGKIVKSTPDSTAYYKKVESEAYKAAALNMNSPKYSEQAFKRALQAGKAIDRQSLKGKPGYDKNGFPIGEWFKKVTTNEKK